MSRLSDCLLMCICILGSSVANHQFAPGVNPQVYQVFVFDIYVYSNYITAECVNFFIVHKRLTLTASVFYFYRFYIVVLFSLI